MKTNDKKILREKKPAELIKMVEDLQKELSVVRMQFAVGKTKDVKLMTKIREKIAIMKTILSEKVRMAV